MRFKVRVGRDFDSELELQVDLDPPQRSSKMFWIGFCSAMVALSIVGLAAYGMLSGNFGPLQEVVALAAKAVVAVLQLLKG